jgi:protein SCO1/2
MFRQRDGVVKALAVAVGVWCVLAAGCDDHRAAASGNVTAATNAQPQYYEVTGVVQEVKPGSGSVVIAHGEVPGYMPAMTMPFDVKDTNELRGLGAGDQVSFRMAIAGRDAWIEQITKTGEAAAGTAAAPARPEWRLVRDVDPLNPGDPLPEYHFTNELGQAVSTSQFKGQALAFTFFFTRCPYPTFCPLMSDNFNDTARKLKAMPGGPTNWHLFSISFDTENDGPRALGQYAGRYGEYDPARWSFLTGDLTEITALADQVGESFWHEGPSITHNLRTVVVDARGRVQTIIPENKWTSDELVAELVKAARAGP